MNIVSKKLINNPTKFIFIQVASFFPKDSNYIGYCISIINNCSGELKSLHVDENFRGMGIGRELVAEHLKWMREKDCKSINVKVSHENDPTISFYKDLGFYPNTLDMQLK